MLRSIKTKVTLAVTASFVVLLALISAVQLHFVRSDMAELLGKEQFALVSRVAEEIDDKLTATHQALILVANNIPAALIGEPKRLAADLENRPGVRSLFDRMFVVSRTGEVLANLPGLSLRGTNVREREYFQLTMKEAKPQISAPIMARSLKQPIIVLTAPVFDRQGRMVGMLAGALNLVRPNFLGKLGTASIGRTGNFALFGHDRTIIMSGERERIMTRGPAPGVSRNFDHAIAGPSGWEEDVNASGLRAVFSYKRLRSVPWVLMAALPVEEAYAPIVAAQTRIVEVALLLGLLLAPLVWLGTERLIAPLLALRNTIREMRRGSGKLPQSLVDRRDEIGDLAAEFSSLMRERNETGAALEQSAHRLRMIADSMPALIAYIDAGERYRFANATYQEWFGLAQEQMIGRTLREVYGEQGYALRAPHIRQVLSGHEVEAGFPVSSGGAERNIQLRYVPDRDEHGRVPGFYVLANDVTALKRTERMLRDSERQLSLALESSQLALFDWNIASGDVYLSERWSVLLGAESAATRTTFAALDQLVHPEDRPRVSGLIRDALKGTSSHYLAEHRVRTQSGEWIWIQSHGRVTARGPDGRALRLIGTSADISERKRAESELIESRAELERAARHDHLTGLPNRHLLMDRLEQVLARARRSGQLLALFYVDVDRFKTINDKFGHAAGDALLKGFAERLNACVRESDTVARLGGDEFVVLLEELHRVGDAHSIARKIVEAMRRDFHFEGQALRASASIGVTFTRGAADGEELLKQADSALYEAKGAGRNRYQVASSDEKLEQSPVAPVRSIK